MTYINSLHPLYQQNSHSQSKHIQYLYGYSQQRDTVQSVHPNITYEHKKKKNANKHCICIYVHVIRMLNSLTYHL